MGGDGGSISKRSEMVKTKKKKTLEDPSVEEHNRWACCSISSQPLRSPTVVCALGNLYNRQAAVDYLLLMKQLQKEGKEPPYNLAHIRSLKHIWNAKLHFDDKAKVADPKAIIFFSCPITGLPGNGKFRFIHMTKCGCVLAEKAYQQVPSSTCLGCGAKLSKTLDFSHTSTIHNGESSNTDDKRDTSADEKKAVPAPSAPSSTPSSSSTSSSSSSRLVEERARMDMEQSARDAADAAAAPDPNAVDWTYLCPSSERTKVMRRQLIAKLEAEMAADAEARRAKKAAKKASSGAVAVTVAVTAATSTTSSTTSTTTIPIAANNNIGGAGGTKRTRGPVAPSVAASASADTKVDIPTDAKKRRKGDVGNASNGNKTKQLVATAKVVKSVAEGRSEVFKSLFLPKDAHLRPSVPNFTSTKPHSAMPALF